MAVEIVIQHLIPTEIMVIVRNLREIGCTQGTDFDFAYTPENIELFGTNNYHRFTVFTFYTEKYATWFRLKYSQFLL